MHMWSWTGWSGQVEILETLLAADFTIWNYNRFDFREFLPAHITGDELELAGHNSRKSADNPMYYMRLL